jgi:hypothetical protein
MHERIHAMLPKLRPLRVCAVVLGVAVLAAVFGQLGSWPTAGRVVAVAMLPLLVRPAPAGSPRWRPGLDALQALAAGLLVAALCQWVWAPGLLADGQTTGSDVAEWFWTLHSLSNPGWEHFSANRYPMAPLLVRLLTFADNPHGAWYAAAIGSMAVTAAGLWLWGRSVAGPAAGWAAALMVGALPDLVVMCRSVTGYPEIIATWTMAAGLAAYALRHPRAWTCLLAGLGCGACFAVDPRGLIPGSLITTVALLAPLLARGRWWRRGVLLLLVLAPLYGSWLTHNRLPLQPRPLEGLLATSVQVSYHRMGQEAPWDLGVSEGWIWGRSMAWEVPATVQAMRQARTRLNPAVATSAEQQSAVRRNVLPIAAVLAALALLAGLAIVRPRPEGAEGWRAWLGRVDGRAVLALLPLAAHIAWFANTVQFEYYTRYFALAMPGAALLTGVGLTALAGRRRPAWVAVLPVLLVLWVVPSNLNVQASWRGRGAAQKELQQCLAAVRGEIERPGFEQRGQDNGLFECVAAQSEPMDRPVRWPW